MCCVSGGVGVSCESQGQVRSMATLGAMLYKGYHKKRAPKHPTFGKPQLKGVVLKVIIKKPKKPNSANRKCVRVRLSNGKEVTAYIPGIGHNLQEHHIVLVRGGKVQDLPGVKHKCIRGKHDLAHVIKKTGWSAILTITKLNNCENQFFDKKNWHIYI